MTTTEHPDTPPAPNPRDTFLKAQEVIDRYRWGRTKGYLTLASADFPNSIGGNYRLDTLLRWEDEQLNSPTPSVPSATLPVARRGGRRAA